jgi:hypothetical protein
VFLFLNLIYKERLNDIEKIMKDNENVALRLQLLARVSSHNQSIVSIPSPYSNLIITSNSSLEELHRLHALGVAAKDPSGHIIEVGAGASLEAVVLRVNTDWEDSKSARRSP